MNKFKIFLGKNKKHILKSTFIILILSLVLFQGVKEVKSIDFKETLIILKSLAPRNFLVFLILGLIAISSMSLYDFLIVKELGLRINPVSLYFLSFLSNSLNNLSGLGGLTGATIRNILLRNSKNKETDLLDYSLLLIPATGIGLSVFGLVSLFKPSYLGSIFKEYPWLALFLIAFLLFIPVYINLEKLLRKFNKPCSLRDRPERKASKLKLIPVSILEWFLGFLLFYSISRSFGWQAGFFKLLVIFSLSSMVGVLSMLPGGLASFDILVLIQFQNLGFSTELGLAIVILYRVFYYLLPLIISIVFTLVFQSRSKDKLLEFPRIKSFINKTAPITNLLLSTLILIASAILLIDGLFPSIIEGNSFMTKYVPRTFLELSYNIQIALGILLLGTVKQIRNRVKRSYTITLVLLVMAMTVLFFKKSSYIEVFYLLIVILLLYLSKNSFYRESIPKETLKTVFNFIIFALAIGLYTKSSAMILNSIFKKQRLSRLNPNDFKGLLVRYGLPILIYFFFEISKRTIDYDERYENFKEDKFSDFLDRVPGNYTAHLGYLGDKSIFYSSGDVLIQYAIKDNLAIVLGDPIGDSSNFQEALNEFLQFIDLYGYKSVFYEASEELLAFYHDNGYHFFKLGETGILNLEDFSLEGPKSRDFRNNLKRFEKDGYVFDFLPKEDIDEKLLDQLKLVSDQWLGKRKEMKFSLGYFDRSYLKKSDLGLIRQLGTGQIIAFASIMPSYDNKGVSIDLMRLREDAPSNSMMFLMLNLILHFKSLNYQDFNLGMAPLSNVGTSKRSHKGEKMAHMLFEYGNFFYSFQGLRNFKNKFKPDWQGRYLVYEDLAQLPHILMEVTSLIHSEV